MNAKNRTFSRLLAISAVLGVCLIGPAVVQAEDPSAPTVTVLAYYDGEPSLTEIYEQALLGFAENAHYLPMVETADAIAFEDALVNGDYDVFVAVTADGALAEDWAELVPPDTNFAAFYPSADPDFEVTTKIVFHRIVDTEVPKEVRHISIAPVIVTSATLVGGGGVGGLLAIQQLGYASAAGDGWAERLGDRVGDRVTTTFQRVMRWLEEQRIKAQRDAAEILRKIAAAIESLPNPEDIEATFKITIGLNPTPTFLFEWEIKTKGENTAALAILLADAVDPDKPTTLPPTPQPGP